MRIVLSGANDSRLVVPMNPYPVKSEAMATISVFVITPRHGFHLGRRAIAFELSDGKGWHEREEWELLGPGSMPGENTGESE